MRPEPRRRAVSVIGGARCTPDEARLAEEVGRLLAQRDIVLVCGGRGGVMEAACRGARSEAGLSIGLLPGTDREGANAYLTVALPTGLGEARNALVAQAGEAVIAIGGEYGTLSEIALALKSGRPVIGIHTWVASRADGTAAEIIPADSASQAVNLALAELERTRAER